MLYLLKIIKWKIIEQFTFNHLYKKEYEYSYYLGGQLIDKKTTEKLDF
jgi:hypothetical protein